MTAITDRPWAFVAILTALSGVIWTLLGTGLFDRGPVASAVLGVVTGFTIALVMLYGQRTRD